MSYKEFKKRIDTARNILVGAVPSPVGQIDQITYALIYKFMNDIDDQSAALGGKRTYFVGDYAKFNWHELMSSSLGAHERLELYREAIQTMARNPNIPELFRSIYQNAFLPFNSANVLNLFLKEMDKFSHGESDDIGDAYEYLLSITGAQGDVGQFRTPRHIIKFIVEAVNPTKDDKVLDPAVGTAGFLIAAYNHVRSQHDGKDKDGNTNNEKRLTADELDKIHRNYRGFDIDPTMVRTAKVNMYLHGFKTPDIINHDSLSSEEYWNDRYDVILANPPFMTPKGGIQPHKKFGISANRAEVLFVDYIASHLKPTGRAGIVVPEGIIFQSGKAYKELRKNLVENYLYAVVSLPAGVFQPYSGVKTSVLLFDKELAKQRDEILFVKVENDGYSLGAQRRAVAGDQFPEALDIIEKFKAGEEFSSEFAHTVSRSEIAESGDYNLSGDRYKSSIAATHRDWPLVKLQDIFTEIKNGKNVKQADDGGKYRVSRIQTIATGKVNLEATKWTSDDVKDSDFLQNGDILFSHINSYDHLAKTALFNEDDKVVHGANLLRLRPDTSKAEPKFLSYLLKSDNFINDARRFAQKAVNQASINSTSVKNLEIPLPPIEIQREIVAELDGYQKIIDAAQTIVQTYKPTIKINPEWKVSKLENLIKLTRGITYSKKDESPEGHQVLRANNIDLGGQLNLSDIKTIASTLEFKEDKKLKKGDVFICLASGSKDHIGKVAYVERDLNMYFGGFMGAVRPQDEKSLNSRYLYYSLTSESFNQYLRGAISGANINNLNSSILGNFKIPLPPIETQREIVAELEAEQQLINANKKLIEIYQQKIKSKIAEVWGE